MRTSWWIALIAVILASVVGIALGRYLLAPVRAVASGARDLAAGRYDSRLTVDRSDEFGALARDFNLLAAGLEANRESRRRWLADIAHELRTPLAVLRAEIEALRDGVRSLDHDAMAALAAEAERIGHLVDDLHQLALADAGALSYHFAPLDPMALLEATALRYQPRLEAAGLTLKLLLPESLPESAPPLFGDSERLEQLLANLLENSLRHTDAPRTVHQAYRLRNCPTCSNVSPAGKHRETGLAGVQGSASPSHAASPRPTAAASKAATRNSAACV